MSTNLDDVKITKIFRVDHWFVRAEFLHPTQGVLPSHIFIYENTGTTTLGVYWGVCGLEELQRLQEWSGVAVQKFANKFVRHDVAEIHLTPGTAPDVTISLILRGLKNLKDAIVAASESSSVHLIG